MFIIVVVFAIIVGNSFFDKAIDTRVTNTLNSESSRMKYEIEHNIEEISQIGYLFSSMQTVMNDLLICRNLQLDDFKNYEKYLTKDFIDLGKKFSYNVDFILPDGQMVYSNHDKSILKEDNKKLIKQIINSQVSYSGYSNLFDEKVIVSIYPVTKNNENAGVVIISKTLEELAKAFYLPSNVGLIIFDEKNNLLLHSSKIDNSQAYRAIKNNKNEEYQLENLKIKPIVMQNTNKTVFATALIFFDVTTETGFIKELLLYLMLFSLGAFVIGGTIYSWGINSTIVKPITKLNDKINTLSKGEITNILDYKSGDELGQIVELINKLIKNQKTTSEFAKNIGLGKYNIEYTPLSENDEIGNSLVEMKNKLKQASIEQDKQHEEEQKRNWAIAGIAEFGEILRQNTDNIEELSNTIMVKLIKYINANQGGLYVYNDNDPENVTLDLVAMYAYNRKKLLQQNIKLGEGLVGTCAIEKETIFIKDVPEDYINITSGLGEAVPRSILLVPLKIEENIFGVIEVASFEVFEDHIIDFVERLGVSIAQSVNSTRIKIKIAQLLEQSQQQQKEMKLKEEELRKTMEEMRMAQEKTKE
jgi:methyl-accepting chemotaxis protein